MHLPPIPPDEAARLAALRELVILDSEPEPLFDSLARLASDACGTPIALVSLVDAERQWFKANVGLPGVNETPRDIAFCAHAIVNADLFEVGDTQRDDRFADNPLVTGQPDIRFYAGVPLQAPGGQRVGTLCVIDRQPRRLDPLQARALRDLATVVTQALVMRRDLIQRTLAVRSDFEQRLAASEDRHRRLVETQTELVSLARPDGRLVYVNPAYARQFGLEPAAMIGENLLDRVDAGDRAAVRARLDAVLAGRQVDAVENRMVSADGRACWVAWTNRLQHDADGSALLHSVGRDVTERVLAERALRSSQAFLERTGRVAGVGGWELELDSGKVTWSPVTRRLLGLDAHGEPTLEDSVHCFAVEAQQMMRLALKAAIDHGVAWDLEVPLRPAPGRTGWVRSVGERELADDGRPLRLVGALQDIGDRKALEQRLAANERFVRQVTDHLPVRIAYVDRGLRYRFVNEAQCQHFNLDRGAIIGRTRAELMHGVLDDRPLAHAHEALCGRAQRYEYEEVVGSERRRIEDQLVPDVDADGTVLGYFASGIDITERSDIERSLRELTAIIEATTDFVLQTDSKGRVVYMNPALRDFVGLADDAPPGGHHVTDVMTAETAELYRQVMLPALAQRGVWTGQSVVIGARRQAVPVSHLLIAHRDERGRVDRYSAVMRDIFDLEQARQALALQADTLGSILEAVPAMVAVVGADRRCRFINKSFEHWAARPRAQIIGSAMADVLGEPQTGHTPDWAQRALAGETVHYDAHFPDRAEASHLSISLVPLRLSSGAIDGFVVVAQDITRHKREAVRLLELTQRDVLTGLLNRAGLEETLQRLMDPQDRGDVALLYIDLDRFKAVNDEHGHAVGDELLRQFGQRLRSLVRPTDAVARLGGDEFALALAAMQDIGNAYRVADKVVDAAARPFEFDGRQLCVGASVGVAFGLDRRTGWDDLLQRADAMLYEAKAAGRGRIAGERR